MALGHIGQPMQSAQPEVIQWQPTRGYWDARRKWDAEVKEALEAGIDTADLPVTGVVPGSYSLASLTVGADGRLTAASSGSLSATGVTPGTYRRATVTVGADGRLTAVSLDSRMMRMSAAAGSPRGAPTLAQQGYWTATAGSDQLLWALDLATNDKVVSISVYAGVAATTAWNFALYKTMLMTGTTTNQGGGTSTTIGGITKVSVTLNEVVVADAAYLINFSFGAVGNIAYGFEMRVDAV